MDSQQIAGVRRFNRELTRRLGVLTDSFLGRGRPLSEARLLYEIGNRGAEVRDLRSRLSLDSGYLSRLVRSLERQKLIESKTSLRDARVRTLTLTRRGAMEVRALDRLSDEFATSVLEPLSREQRARLIEAMSQVERLMRAAAVQLSLVPAGGPDAVFCLEQYFHELGDRFSAGFDPARSISASAEELTPPAGYFLAARLDERPIGCGALKLKDARVGEIKRMWVAPAVRGVGVGARILAALEQRARMAGLQVLRLETNRALQEAQRLYRRCGYLEVERFNDEPYAHHWFEKRLLPESERNPFSGD